MFTLLPSRSLSGSGIARFRFVNVFRYRPAVVTPDRPSAFFHMNARFDGHLLPVRQQFARDVRLHVRKRGGQVTFGSVING